MSLSDPSKIGGGMVSKMCRGRPEVGSYPRFLRAVERLGGGCADILSGRDGVASIWVWLATVTGRRGKTAEWAAVFTHGYVVGR